MSNILHKMALKILQNSVMSQEINSFLSRASWLGVLNIVEEHILFYSIKIILSVSLDLCNDVVLANYTSA